MWDFNYLHPSFDKIKISHTLRYTRNKGLQAPVFLIIGPLPNVLKAKEPKLPSSCQ